MCPLKLKEKDLKDRLNNIKNTFDVLTLNKKIFPNESEKIKLSNCRLKSYDLNDIIHLLNYKRSNNLSIKETSRKFNISKTTITKWNKLYIDQI